MLSPDPTLNAQLVHWFSAFRRTLASDPKYCGLDRWLPDVTEQNADYEILRRQYQLFMEATAIVPGATELLMDAVAATTNQPDTLQEQVDPPASADPDAKAWLEQMETLGHAALPALSSDLLASALRHLEALPVTIDEQSPTLTVEEARTSGANIATYGSDSILANADLLRFVTSRDLVSRLRRLLGAPPILLLPTAWWSFSNAETERDAQLFHIDQDDIKFCKLFLYLTDVDEESGPHAYLERTHRLDTIQVCRERYTGPKSAFDTWYREKLRKTDTEIDHYLGLSPTHITGEAGTVFTANTRAIHRGVKPTVRDRLIVQFTIGVSPQLTSMPMPQTCPPSLPADVQQQLQDPAIAYFLQLYLKPPG